MKIFTNSQIKELDKFTIEHEPISSIDLMERAARTITRSITEEWNNDTPITVFAGPGNNGGDALAVARMLAEKGYKVSAFLFNISNDLSADCVVNRDRLKKNQNVKEFTEVTIKFDPPELTADMLVVDGLFGSGLNKPIAGGFASLIKYINQSDAQVVSIDIPSGLMAEDNSSNVRANIIQADVTLSLHQRKLAFLFADTQEFLGRVKVLDIGLSREYIKTTDTEFSILDESTVRALIHQRNEFAHKGSMGNALIVAGSYGMAGAAVMATRACLRSGVGKATVHIPEKNYTIIQTSVPEAIVQIDADEEKFTETVDAEKFDSLGIGPGLGTDENTAIAIISQIRRTRCPIVADADALNILSTHRAWMQQLPKGIILTPHAKEMERLAGSASTCDYERLNSARNMARNLNAYIILKGKNSALCLPNGKVIFNPTGNSGMATAGSGDVLTGILTALLARGYSELNACIIGMFIHGAAGDMAARKFGKESLMAGDIIDYLPEVFKRLYE